MMISTAQPNGRNILVSVVSAYYNRRDYVTESINSLLGQTYPWIEMIIIDDGSTDDTYEMLSAISDSRLRVVRQENQGFVRAIRRAIELSSGDFVAIHGSGDFSFPQRIERQVEFLQAHPDIGVVGCYVENVDADSGAISMNRWVVNGDPTRELMKENILNHGSVMFRRSLYDAVGGYRTAFTYAEDYDLWLRMSLHAGIGMVKEVLYRRYHLPDGVSRVLEKRVMQRYLAEFALQCAEMRIVTGMDLIDRHGAGGLLWRRRSARLAELLQRNARQLMGTGHTAEARWVNNLSLQEHRTLRGIALWLYLVIRGHGPLRKGLLDRPYRVLDSILRKCSSQRHPPRAV